MNNEMTNQTTETPTRPNNAEAQGESTAVSLLKLAGAAFMLYRAISAPKQQKAQEAKQSSDQPSMASIDRGALLNMGLEHMRNMTKITTRF